MIPKEKLVRVSTNTMSNELFFRFMVENREYYQKYGPAQLDINVYMVEYDEALSILDAALEHVRKSPDTTRIALLDAQFGSTFSGMESYTKAFLNHFDSNMRAAAENLMVIFNHYGNISRQPYREELASSYNLLQDLRQHPNEVNKLTLEPWIQAHEAVANELSALLESRTSSAAKQTGIRVTDARRQIENIYQRITDRLDAVINLHGATHLGEFYAEYNAHASEYKNMLAQHFGRLRKKKENNAE